VIQIKTIPERSVPAIIKTCSQPNEVIADQSQDSREQKQLWAAPILYITICRACDEYYQPFSGAGGKPSSDLSLWDPWNNCGELVLIFELSDPEVYHLNSKRFYFFQSKRRYFHRYISRACVYAVFFDFPVNGLQTDTVPFSRDPTNKWICLPDWNMEWICPILGSNCSLLHFLKIF
jgi:hypothetical protein